MSASASLWTAGSPHRSCATWRPSGALAAAEIDHARRIPLHVFMVGPEVDLADPDGSWVTTYGVEQDGAVLIRPDGHVAWRSRSRVNNPAQALHGVLASVLGETVA